MREREYKAPRLLTVASILLLAIGCGKKMASPPPPIDAYQGIVGNDS